MLSKISYCPLDEAWSLCRPLDNVPSTLPDPTVVEIGGNNNNYMLTTKQLPSNNLERDFSSYLQTKNEHQDTANQLSLTPKRDICQLFLKHIDSCPGCRKKIEEKYGQVVEKFISNPPTNTPNYFEISMIILVGIILIVIMDSFVRIGKLIHK
jgi:hypothetical protein